MRSGHQPCQSAGNCIQGEIIGKDEDLPAVLGLTENGGEIERGEQSLPLPDFAFLPGWNFWHTTQCADGHHLPVVSHFRHMQIHPVSQLPEHQIDPSWKRPMDGAVENPSSLSREELVSSRSHETRPLVTSTAGPWLPLPKRTAPGPTTTTKRWCFVSPTIGAGSVCAQC